MATAPEQAAAVPLALDRIRTDGGTQMRVDLNEDVVEEYAQTIRAGTDLPPIVVFLDGSKHWLADGFHRFFGYQKAGAETIQAEIRQGTKRDAILYSVGANAGHGLRRTNEDKRKAVLTLLKDKEWKEWPQAKIAAACGVSREFVNRLAQSASCDRSQDSKRTVTRGGATFEQNTANIGKAADAADRAEKTAEAKRQREEQQAINDRERDEHREALPDAAKQHLAAKEERRQTKGERAFEAAEKSGAKDEARNDRQVAELMAAWEAAGEVARQGFLLIARADSRDGDLPPEDRIAELEEANRVLEAEIAELRKENTFYADMKVEWAKGGFDEVVTGLKQQITLLGRQVESISDDRAAYLRQVKYWKEEARKLGYSNTLVIDTATGEASNG